jgi:hypothetical protein
MNISAFHKRYPDAKVIGPGGIDQKKPDVKWTGIMGQGGEDVTYGFEDEVSRRVIYPWFAGAVAGSGLFSHSKTQPKPSDRFG